MLLLLRGVLFIIRKRDPEADWSRLKVKLPGKDYEYMVDIRKVFRVSVSAFFALAVEDHLDELVDILTGKSQKVTRITIFMLVTSFRIRS